jgi:cytochrome c peroxidase
MKSSYALVAILGFSFAATPAFSQFLEAPTPPPPSLKEVALPTVTETLSELPLVDEATPDGANGFIKDEAAAVLLGKAFFWDMQMGSDEVACATCHYHAGADNRSTNQVSPGLNGGNGVFDVQNGGKIGPNSALLNKDFPFHELADPADRDSLVVFDTDDVASSAGMFASDFNDIVEGNAIDNCTPITPAGNEFHLNNGLLTRQVEPRNTPTIINAAFNDRNFWDGRANNVFNGVDGSGLRNTAARVLEDQSGSVVQIQVAFENSSLASQAVVPGLASFETSCIGRIHPKIGKKLLSLQPLALQKVHPHDSVLGAVRDNPRGLTVSYQTLIQNAISDRFWDSNALFDANQNQVGTGAPANTGEYTLMEANFSLIWGLAIQTFERTQISDDTPFDQWAEAPGDRSPTIENTKGILTEQQMIGMDLFFTNTIGARGQCSTCHQGPTFTTVAFPFTIEEESGEFPEQEQRVERMKMGDGVNVAEDLFRFFVRGEGSVGGYSLAGTAGSRNLPTRYPAASGGDFSVNSCQREVYSYLMNQDTILIPNPGGPFPPFIEVPNSATRDALFVLRGCGEWLQVSLIDGGPGNDTATVQEIEPIVLPPPQMAPGLIPTFIGSPTTGPLDGDFTLNGPTLYDTAFYNIGVRPTDEDPGIGADDAFGNPLSFTKQWQASLITGAPTPDDFPLVLARLHLPFNWYGDGVFFPGGLTGPEWPILGFFPCDPPIFGAPPAGLFGACTLGVEGGKGHEAYPKYPTGLGPFVDAAQAAAINNMNTAVDGAFKVPGLRNATLTGPFFHNGGSGTLDQVVEFYNRGGDFAIENLGNLSPNIQPLGLDQTQRDAIVAFLGTLTDERVRCKQAPFDHPEIILPEGHQTQSDGSGQAKDKTTTINAVGASGVNSNKCIGPFLE